MRCSYISCCTATSWPAGILDVSKLVAHVRGFDTNQQLSIIEAVEESRWLPDLEIW